MFDEKTYEYLAQEIADLYEPIQTHYLDLMGEHLRDIGKLTPSDVHRLKQIQRMRGNAREIAEELSMVSKKAVSEVEKLFTEIAKDDYDFAQRFYKAKGIKQIPFSQNKALKRIVAAEAERTSGLLSNLSQTTASQIKRNPSNYRQAIDTAVRAASSGISDYGTAIRRVIRKAASEGLTFIDFDSGYRRRLDSQIRMNVLEGIKQTNMGVARQVGKEYGADGVEISVHGLCAPDHIHIQGKQFSNKQFEKLQESLDRPIGTLNCKHFAFPILLGISTPAHSDNELNEYRKLSEEKIEIDGVEKTRYEWSQNQRQIETAVRKQKDIAVAAKASGDMNLRREAQASINSYKDKYNYISKSANLELYNERMAVSGFKHVKAYEQLKNSPGKSIIQDKINDGSISLNLNREKQGRHILGNPLYKNGKSFLSIPENEIQDVINRCYGTGEVVYDKKGVWKNKEKVDCGKIIGFNIDPTTNVKCETSKATIHYSKTGTHIVPRKER